jgi:hypothetical protein
MKKVLRTALANIVAFILSGIEYTAGILSAKSDTENAWLPRKRQPILQIFSDRIRDQICLEEFRYVCIPSLDIQHPIPYLYPYPNTQMAYL